MRVSPRGLYEIACHEGVCFTPYKDVAGVWTVGFGHTESAGSPNPVKMSPDKPISLETALGIFIQDIEKYEDRVTYAVNADITQAQFDALVSFDYNTGGITRARLTRYLNDGRPIEQVADAFMGWSKPPAIVGRRKAERELFLTGRYSHEKNNRRIAVHEAHDNGNLRPTPVSHISYDEFMEAMGASKSDDKPEGGCALCKFLSRILSKILGVLGRP